MSEPFIGEIKVFAGNFAIRGWAFCNGQLLSISQNSALFAILGNTYGGDGVTTFGVPDFRGRTPVGAGQGPGLPAVQLGELSGTETVTLITNQYPAHSHTVASTQDNSASTQPNGNIFAAQAGLIGQIYGSPANLVGMDPQMLTAAPGGNQPHENVQPFLALTFLIALEGIFPSRN